MFGERPRLFAVLLAVSVLLNLFLGGIIAGSLAIPAFIRNAPVDIGLVPRAQVHELPLAERHQFAAAMRRHAAQLRALHARVLQARRAAEEAIGAPHYGRALLESRFAAVRQTQLAQQTETHEALIEALGAVSAQSRAAIAARAEANAKAQP